MPLLSLLNILTFEKSNFFQILKINLDKKLILIGQMPYDLAALQSHLI